MFVNSSPQRWLADCDISSLHLIHLLPTPYSYLNHCDVMMDLLLHYIQDNFLLKMLMVAKSPNIRHYRHTRAQAYSRDIWELFLLNI